MIQLIYKRSQIAARSTILFTDLISPSSHRPMNQISKAVVS